MIPRGNLQRIFNLAIGLAPRSQQAYATHVPVLVGVASVFKPKLLIEFGAGTFSTLSFLDREAFPTIERVASYENNKVWFDEIRTKLPTNGPIHLRFVDGEMCKAVNAAGTPESDLIFIDDSPTARARVPTVEEVARHCGAGPVVVLHDSELWRLRLATHKFQHRVSFGAFNPQSCAMWNGHPERKPLIESVSRILQSHAAKISPIELRVWKTVFSTQLK